MEMKSLTRKFGLRHVLKVANEVNLYRREAIKDLYLTYRFLGKEVNKGMEIYRFEAFGKAFEVKRLLKNGVLYLKGVFGCFKADEVDKVIVEALNIK